MANLDQPYTTISGDGAARKRMVTDYRSMIDRMDTPFVSWIGPSSANGKFRFVNNPQPQLIWLEDTHRVLSGTLAATMASDDTTMTVSDGTDFRIGDILALGTEKLWVSAISTNTLTVSRGVMGTTAATQATGTITIDSWAELEADDFNYGPIEDISSNSNYIQVFGWTVKVSDLQLNFEQYGASDELEYQMDKSVPELMRAFERAIFRNPAAAVGTATTPYFMAGLPAFVTTNSLSTTAANLTLGDIKNLFLSCELAGSKPDTLVCSHLRQQTITALIENSTYLRVTQSENSVGMAVDRIHTPWGSMDVVASPHCPDTAVYFLNRDHVGLYEVESPAIQDTVAKVGTYTGKYAECIYSLVVRHNAAHAYLNLSA